ncbi:Glucose-1-phosphate adenylyltransferase [Candidatus Izimaplasma bacterium HR1]|jgi:glucose-1-phosphate adenylyltransferase|uniref:glucose-1-phosphate adenylyltransferase n=1 Tax=Candidatus Izimoplasma sp. HR1 TaxID=1541959 RepID=UPI0004F61ACC|nr:Glucose-1-phosphate adenylyltransferase [Candidatus Izimaplasma bacterium HR1]
MKKQVIAMVMVGGRGTRLGNITKSTAKPAVSFGGKYHLIDFVLSNLTNSNILTCGIITQYEPHELMSYIGHGSTWDLDVNEGGISFLTPYATQNDQLWQNGTANAIHQHIKYIEQYNPDYVLILSGDHIYKMDYNDMINEHIKKEAEISIATFTVDKNASRYGILQSNEKGEVVSFEEKPEKPKSNQASMGIYVFNSKVLRELLELDGKQNTDFGSDIIPLALENKLNVHAFEFNGYFRDVGTIESLYEANMDLLDNPQYLKLREYVDFPVYAKSGNLPPHHIAEKCKVINSLISDGCLIYGDLEHSILSSGVVIEHGSKIVDTIVHKNVRIGKLSYIKNAIIMENSVILPNTKLVFNKVTVVDNEYLWKLGETNE